MTTLFGLCGLIIQALCVAFVLVVDSDGSVSVVEAVLLGGIVVACVAAAAIIILGSVYDDRARTTRAGGARNRATTQGRETQ